MLAPINHPPSVSLLSFTLPYKAIYMLFFFLLFKVICYTIIYAIVLQQHIGKLNEWGRESNENRKTFKHINNISNFLYSQIKEANI